MTVVLIQRLCFIIGGILMMMNVGIVSAVAECEIDGSGGETCRDTSMLPVSYPCPKIESARATSNGEELLTESWNAQRDYISPSQDILTNMTRFMANFRDQVFDTYAHTYNEYKTAMKPFKSKYYPKYLQSGGTLYESAHGIGMNMLMTLEILEEHGITDIYVYGNEYIDVSAVKAMHVLDAMPVANSKRGIICAADSTELSFVPANSFDVVYTGYICPMLNPLNFQLSQEENFNEYQKLCRSKDPNLIKVKDRAQQIQNDWIGNWAKQMARIAKPGAPIIIEQAAVTYCDCTIDWGGVPQEFWKEHAINNTYGWDVDPESVIIELDTLYLKRYHVVMVKKKENQKRGR